MIGAVIFGVILLALGGAEAKGLYDEHVSHDPKWLPLTSYVRAAPWWVRLPVFCFCCWLALHFSVGVA